MEALAGIASKKFHHISRLSRSTLAYYLLQLPPLLKSRRIGPYTGNGAGLFCSRAEGGWGTYRRTLVVSAILLLRRVTLLGRIAAITMYCNEGSALLFYCGIRIVRVGRRSSGLRSLPGRKSDIPLLRVLRTLVVISLACHYTD